ncbi:MAG: Mut7-C RNAse domain-containing protein [Sulfolobaceae archaeon]
MQSQKFIVDAMLGRVARWLRILGYDTLYSRTAEDWWLLKKASEENRILITRDRGLYIRARKKGIECLLLNTNDDIILNLAKIAKKYKIDLDISIEASRCALCNSVLEKIDKERWRCSKCKKEYWKGRHWKTMNEILFKARMLILRDERGERISEIRRNRRYDRENVNTDSKEGSISKIRVREIKS